MKKLVTILATLLLTLSAHAQFEKDKKYLSASLSGLSLNYSGKNGFDLGLSAKAGYLLEDNWMVLAEAGYQHTGAKGVSDRIHLGVGGRYYIVQNGLFLGVNAKLLHENHNHNDFMPGAEVGYAFFVSRTVTIEPSVYYQQSLSNHSDFSSVGLNIGVGIYL